jgi:hypothetical protein
MTDGPIPAFKLIEFNTNHSSTDGRFTSSKSSLGLSDLKVGDKVVVRKRDTQGEYEYTGKVSYVDGTQAEVSGKYTSGERPFKKIIVRDGDERLISVQPASTTKTALTPKVTTSGVTTMSTGSVSGPRAAIEAWAKGSDWKPEMYHYSSARDAVMKQGFDRSKDKSEGDGTYFAFDKAISKGVNGSSGDAITVRMNVKPSGIARLNSPSPKLQRDLDTWYQRGHDDPATPGTIGPFMREFGYKMWSDGMQVGVMDSKIIGIIDD